MSFIVHCGDCLHQWEPIQLPADLRDFSKAARNPCPICGASAKRVFCSQAPTERMATRPMITEAQAIRIALDTEARERVIKLWPAPDCSNFGEFTFKLTFAICRITDITVKFIEMAQQHLGHHAELDLFKANYAAVLSAPVRDAAMSGWDASNRWTVINEHLRGAVLSRCDRPGRLDEVRADIMDGVRWNG